MEKLSDLAETLSGALKGAVTESKIMAGELTVTVEAARILDVLSWLQGEGEFKILVDICGNDWPQRAKRFDVVYHLLSLTRNHRVRVHVLRIEPWAVSRRGVISGIPI